jgi:hypothetical protein
MSAQKTLRLSSFVSLIEGIIFSWPYQTGLEKRIDKKWEIQLYILRINGSNLQLEAGYSEKHLFSSVPPGKHWDNILE